LLVAHFDATVHTSHDLFRRPDPVNALRTSVQPKPTAALLRADARLSCAMLAH